MGKRTGVVVTIKETISLFAIFDIPARLIEQTMTDEPGTSSTSKTMEEQVLEIAVLRRGLLDFLHQRAKQIPDGYKKYPYAFTVAERSQLTQWFLEVSSVVNLDDPSLQEDQAKEQKLKEEDLIGLFNANDEINDLSTSIKATESIIQGLRRQREDTENQGREVTENAREPA